ncbi:putative transposase [Trichonephila clavipes]|nr:putative transposase [Trichonephila clavipes]
MKNHLKEHHFGTLENTQTAVTDQLKAIPISEFHQCYEEWKKRLQRCVASEGSYFEEDNAKLSSYGVFNVTSSSFLSQHIIINCDSSNTLCIGHKG